MDEQLFTIGELADRGGVTPRTIRYYQAEGLLPAPKTEGRYAQYTTEHLDRLRLIAQLKQQFLLLEEIKARITHLTAEQVNQIVQAPAEQPGAPKSNAASYLARVLPRLQQNSPQPPAPRPLGYRGPTASVETPSAWNDAPGAAQIAEAPSLRQYEIEPPAPLTKAPATEELWRHITLGPGVELRLREPTSAERRTRIERLIAIARDILNDEPNQA